MDRSLIQMFGIATAVMLAAFLGIFMYKSINSASTGVHTTTGDDAELSVRLEDDICDSYDRKTTTGAQVIELIDTASGYAMRVRVQSGSSYDYYIYADDALSTPSDDNTADMISRARRTISGTTIYVGSVDKDANGNIIGVTFNYS